MYVMQLIVYLFTMLTLFVHGASTCGLKSALYFVNSNGYFGEASEYDIFCKLTAKYSLNMQYTRGYFVADDAPKMHINRANMAFFENSVFPNQPLALSAGITRLDCNIDSALLLETGLLYTKTFPLTTKFDIATTAYGATLCDMSSSELVSPLSWLFCAKVVLLSKIPFDSIEWLFSLGRSINYIHHNSAFSKRGLFFLTTFVSMAVVL